MKRGIVAFLGLTTIMLAGCTMGPDFKAPAPPDVTRYITNDATPGQSVSDDKSEQKLVAGTDIPAQWWSLFRSPALNQLIEQALQANPDLASAQAAVQVAMENVKAQYGAFYPSVTLDPTAARNKDSAALSPVLSSNALIYNLYQAQLGLSWTPDLWGGNRRQVEALQAQADAQRYQLQNTYVTLAASLVAAVVQEASFSDQIAATQKIIDVEATVLRIERRQHDLGQIAGADVAAQETLLAQDRQLLPTLERQLAQQRNIVTALEGKYPDEQLDYTLTLSDFTLPAEIPSSLPSRLVEQRADIKVAEENLHAASALVGVAIANRLPNITLSANVGGVAADLGKVFAPGNDLWSVGAGLTEPVLDGGTLFHRSKAAEAAFDQAKAQYQSVVISAFQNAADVLVALQTDAEAARAANAAEAAAQRSFSIAEKQVRVGQAGTLSLLNAQQAQLQTTIATVQARAARLADTAALFQALGGGWAQAPLEVSNRN
jgi:NodT family efflux transporter outer membrane factor (OMF) lipoprotein